MSDAMPFEAAPFFALRVPLLAYDELRRLQADLQAAIIDNESGEGDAAAADASALEAALAADRGRLRQRMKDLIDRPEIDEALFVASPDLHESLDIWRDDPLGERGQRIERSLFRYLVRMASRPTPFGLFASCAVGEMANESDLRVSPMDETRRHSRLDMDFLSTLTSELGRDPEVRQRLTYRPNGSLYRAAGRLRYAESRWMDQKRTYHLVAIDSDPYLDATLERARAGARRVELAQALVDDDPDGEIAVEDALSYVDELIDSQVIVSDLEPQVTGDEPIAVLLRQIEQIRQTEQSEQSERLETPDDGDGLAPSASVATAVAAALHSIRDRLAALDRSGLGNNPAAYRELAAGLEQLNRLDVEVRLPRLFQIDMIRPSGQARLGPKVAAVLQEAMVLHHRLSLDATGSALDEMRAEMVERYGEGREVSLVEALDEEIGVGFQRSGSAAAEASPLLAGLQIEQGGRTEGRRWQQRDAFLLNKVQAAVAAGSIEIDLSEADVAAIETPQPAPLPGAFSLLASIAAPSPEALEEGEFDIVSLGGVGPSGARLLGRFCHIDPDLDRFVREHHLAEEALDPEAVYAELVHLPEGRIGNVLQRPVLRGWEIPYLGGSGAPVERQIPVDDLTVTALGDRIVLRSKRLGKRIEPRLATAHNTARESLGLYRFLAALQSYGTAIGLAWSWGALDSARFLPRVRHGRVVLSRARWKVERGEIDSLLEPEGSSEIRPGRRFREVRRWARDLGLPPTITVARSTQSDNELLLDFDNPLAVDAFCDFARGSGEIVIHEHLPSPDSLCAHGPEGVYCHEIVVPFVRKQAALRHRPPIVEPSIARTFAPGSSWVYAKLYTGTATADRVLSMVAAGIEQMFADGLAKRWFFIRYADPRWHLRLRINGDPDELTHQVLPRLQQAIEPLVAEGWVWRVQFDTYEREVERYGGAETIDLAEDLFHHDSRTVLALLGTLDGDAGADARWRLALAGMDRLMTDFGLDLEAKQYIAERSREGLGQRYRVDKPLRDQFAARLRMERKRLDALLQTTLEANAETLRMAPGLAILAGRSVAIQPITARYQSLREGGRLAGSFASVVSSFAHMFVNRLLRSAGPEHELVLWDFLAQLYRSRRARQAALDRNRTDRGKATGIAVQT